MCLQVCCLFKEVYSQILNVFLIDYRAVVGSGKVGPVNQANHTILLAVVTQIDRPQSVNNRCVIEPLVAFCDAVFLS